MRPTTEYPDGSYMRTFDGKVEIATGFFAIEHPDKPSPYWHGKAPFVVFDLEEFPWKVKEPRQNIKVDGFAFIKGGK